MGGPMGGPVQVAVEKTSIIEDVGHISDVTDVPRAQFAAE